MSQQIGSSQFAGMLKRHSEGIRSLGGAGRTSVILPSSHEIPLRPVPTELGTITYKVVVSSQDFLLPFFPLSSILDKSDFPTRPVASRTSVFPCSLNFKFTRYSRWVDNL